MDYRRPTNHHQDDTPPIRKPIARLFHCAGCANTNRFLPCAQNTGGPIPRIPKKHWIERLGRLRSPKIPDAYPRTVPGLSPNPQKPYRCKRGNPGNPPCHRPLQRIQRNPVGGPREFWAAKPPPKHPEEKLGSMVAANRLGPQHPNLTKHKHPLPPLGVLPYTHPYTQNWIQVGLFCNSRPP